MTPRGHAIAFRIWQYCQPLGWDCTLAEVADAIDVTLPTVRAVIKRKNWGGRLRVTRTHHRGAGGNCYALSADAALDGTSSRRVVAELTGTML